MENLFFLQERIGKWWKPFTLYKLQTMYPHDGIRVDMHGRKIEGDELIIPSREWMRKTWFDELPQIINILLGDMCLFGTRAVTPVQFEGFEPEERKRYAESKPGIFGAYLFYRQWGSSDNSPRRANDAYLRLRNRKKKNKWELMRMNMEALRRSVRSILDGNHN